MGLLLQVNYHHQRCFRFLLTQKILCHFPTVDCLQPLQQAFYRLRAFPVQRTSNVIE